MSDTPETDEQINGKPCTRFEVILGDSLRDALVASEFARKLERERDRYKSEVEVITRERDEAREALRILFKDYKELADSGDAGFWELEDKEAAQPALRILQQREAAK